MGGELMFLMIVALLLFGPDDLLKIARSMGRMVYEFRQAMGKGK